MNKEEEGIILRSFINHYPDFPKGKVIESESPDFIIQDGPKTKIGIELVQLLTPPEHHYSMAGILKPKYPLTSPVTFILLSMISNSSKS